MCQLLVPVFVSDQLYRCFLNNIILKEFEVYIYRISNDPQIYFITKMSIARPFINYLSNSVSKSLDYKVSTKFQGVVYLLFAFAMTH